MRIGLGTAGGGENPPFHTPVFVVTRHSREPLELAGGTTFFCHQWDEAAFDQAEQAAGGQDGLVAGGASVVQQS